LRILIVIVVANVVVSLADWYFFGVLWHEKYKAYPEVWRRPEGGPGESKAVALSAMVGAITPTVFVIACVLFNMTRLPQAMLLGTFAWLIGPVPMWIWNYIFMKVHPMILLSGMLGWLVRLGLSAVVVGLLLN
jgi:hypothetical protein